MQGLKLATRRMVAMKYDDILRHPIDLREGYLIQPWSQKRRSVKKVVRRLGGKGSAMDVLRDDRERKYHVGREDDSKFIVD